MRLLLLTFLIMGSICYGQNDSINPQWNNCSIDTLSLDDGTISRINIKQNEWSNAKERTVTSFWERVYYTDGTVQSELTGSKFYKKDGFFHVTSIKKIFNPSGKRISTKRFHYKIPSFI